MYKTAIYAIYGLMCTLGFFVLLIPVTLLFLLVYVIIDNAIKNKD